MPELTIQPAAPEHSLSWEKYIIQRGKLLIEWREEAQRMKELADKWVYVRVRGDSYRPVSIHPANPCGSLKRSDCNGSIIGGTKRLHSALKSAEAAASADAKKPGNKKPEHVVQAGLIHHALTHDMRLDGRLNGFSEFFDELIFITDELKAGDIRADMVALGVKDGKHFPVFMELKAIRSFDRVISQLVDTHKTAMKMKSAFIGMLSSGTGKAASSICFDEYKLLVIWPDSESGKGIASAAKAVLNPRFESAKGHLLLCDFAFSKVARDGYDSVVRLVESA